MEQRRRSELAAVVVVVLVVRRRAGAGSGSGSGRVMLTGWWNLRTRGSTVTTGLTATLPGANCSSPATVSTALADTCITYTTNRLAR